MRSITGDLEVGEASGALKAVLARRRGSNASYLRLLLALMVGGAATGFAIGWAIEWAMELNHVLSILTALAGMWIGRFAYQFMCRKMLVRGFRRNMAERGLDLRFTQTITVTDEALVMQAGPVRYSAEWSAVTELFRDKGYWIFLVHMAPWFAPVRFFPDEAEQKAFIRAALSHLSQEARGRSKQATAYAAD